MTASAKASEIPVTSVWMDHETTRLNPEWATSTPKDATSGGLGELLDRLTRFVAIPQATVMLDGTVPAQLGLSGPRPGLERRTGTPALKSAADRGWTIGDERAWMVARRTEQHQGKSFERVIYLGIVPWLDTTTFALLAPGDSLLTVWRMYEWAGMMGLPFFGEQLGLNGHNVLRDRCTLKSQPRWIPNNWEGIEPARKSTELPFAWKGPQPTTGWVHQFDATAQHLGAMNNVYVAGDMLHRERPSEPVRKNLCGYYRVIPPAWSMGRSLPHPIGRLGKDPTSPVWVTHVTLDFLMELAEDFGIIEPPEILECYVADNRMRVFRTFGEILAKALRRAATYDQDPEMHQAVKTVYKATVGLMARPGGRIYRPDWAHAVIAQARCDLFRKAYREGSRARYTPPRSDDVRIGSGRWPVEVETDSLWYASPTEVPVWPNTFLRGDGLTGGTFTVKKSREV